MGDDSRNSFINKLSKIGSVICSCPYVGQCLSVTDLNTTSVIYKQTNLLMQQRPPLQTLEAKKTSIDLMKNPIEKMANVGQSHLLHNVLDVFCDHIAWMGEYPCMMTYCAHSPLSSCWPSYDRKGAPVCSMHLLTWSHLYLTHSPPMRHPWQQTQYFYP